MEHDIELEGSTYRVDDEFLSDIIVTAIEGGIDYWCSVIRYVTGENPAHTSALIIMEDDTQFDIDIDLILKGIKALIAQPPTNTSRSNMCATYYQIWTWLTDAVKNPKEDNVMIDADVADHVVQMGLFGELAFA